MIPEKQKIKLGIPTNIAIWKTIKGGRDTVREMARARDNWTCQQCGKVWVQGQRRLDVHHLDPKQEGKSKQKNAAKMDLKNFKKLITLCHKCHLNLHSVKKKISKGMKTKRVFTEHENQELQKLYALGIRQYKLAEIFKCSKQTINSKVKKFKQNNA